MLLGGTQTPKVQKLGVQKRSVFLPVGGGVGQFEKQTQTWKNCATLRYVCAVCFIVLLKSCDVSPDRLWPRPCNTTSVWRTSIWSVATSALKGRRLGVWWGWCHEEGSRHSCLKVRSGKWRKATQCSIGAQMCQIWVYRKVLEKLCRDTLFRV